MQRSLYRTGRARPRSSRWRGARKRGRRCPAERALRSGPTTLAACCARRGCIRPARTSPPGGSTRPPCAPSRTRRSRGRCGCRRRSACSPPPTGSSAGPPGTWTSSTRSAGYPRRRPPGREVPQPVGHHRVDPGRAARRQQGPDGPDHLRRGLHVPEVAGEHRRAEADDPVAQHGALPRRPGHRPGGLSRHRGVLVRPGRRLRRGGAAAGRAGLHLPAARRHVAGLPERPGAARRDRRSAARTPSTCTCATSSRSTPRSRQARRHGHDHHLCRGNFRSSWAASGGYDFVAEALFRELAVDGFFLEYDDERRRVRAAAVRAEGQDGCSAW